MSYQIHPTCQIPGLAKIYEDVFGPDFIGSFVEVGAFDGMTYSNTWGLASVGWEGIYIEAHPDFAAQCAILHKNNKVQVVPVACGSFDGQTELIVWGEVSTTKLTKWNRDWGMNEKSPTITVPQMTLDSIVYQYAKSHIDLLVIDVEEAEIEVLRGFGECGVLPTMIIIELHEQQGTGPLEKGWQTPFVDNWMTTRRYKKIYADKINTIYVRES